MSGGTILALDLASVTGWAEGAPGGPITSGSLRLGDAGAGQGERFTALFRWLWTRLSAFPPAAIWFEAPLPPSHMRGHTNVDTSTFLMGLPAVVQTVAQLKGVYRVEKAHVQDVRQHFIAGHGFLYRGKPLTGRRNLPSKEAKFCVTERCRQLGREPHDDNEADAVALLSYALALARPSLGTESTPLFEGAAA